MPPMFQASPFPLGVGGQIAEALHDSNFAGNAAELGSGISDIVGAYKQKKMLNTKLSDLGFDDQHALLAGAAPQLLPGAPLAPGAQGPVQPTVVPPSAMTVRQLMLRKQAAGAQADQATAPTVNQVFSNGLPRTIDPAVGSLPVPLAEKMTPLMKMGAAAQQGQMFGSKAAIDAFMGGGPLPKMSMTPTGALDEQVLDKSHYKAMMELNTERRLNAAAVSADDRKVITDASSAGNLDPTLFETMLSRPEGAKQLADMIRANPGKNLTMQAIETKAKVASATGAGRVTGQQGALADSGMKTVDGILDSLDATLKTLPDATVKLFNKGDLVTLASMNDPEANKALALFSLAAKAQAQAQHVGQGPASGPEMKDAHDMMSTGLSSGGLAGVRSAVDVANNARVKSLGGKGTTPAPTSDANVRVVNSKADYDALPKGTRYKDSNGTIATKK